jgi:4,5-dihydroxyphthalate decarboxylase
LGERFGGKSVAPLDITLACGDYDRTRALADGRVVPEGVELRVVPLEPEEIFRRMVRHLEFDVSELSLSSYVISLQGDAPFVALPVFPSRAFRHNGIYVRAGAGIEQPGDLVGRRIGVAEYQLTANVWIRGILAEFHGVPVASVRYVTGGMHEAGRTEKLAIPALPEDVQLEACPEGRTLSELLLEGDIDGMYTPRVPKSYHDGDPRVRRLFDDVRTAEGAYYDRTGIFPIMHVVAVRRELYEQHRWVARSLYKAFVAAKDLALDRLSETAASAISLPWAYDEAAAVRRRMGEDFWSYGLGDENERALGTFLRYAAEQGIAKEALTPSELFAPETLEDVLV